jgi:hypothetical protein
MYSYEDRMRAVRLYVKLGKRIKATIRQLISRSRWPLREATHGRRSVTFGFLTFFVLAG